MKIINEEKLKPVITSKQVMIENKPITMLYTMMMVIGYVFMHIQLKKMMLILFQ